MPLIHRGNGGSSSRRNLTNPKFEELVLCAVQALHPKRRLKRSDIKMNRVRKLLKQVLNGRFPSQTQIKSKQSSPPQQRIPKHHTVSHNNVISSTIPQLSSRIGSPTVSKRSRRPSILPKIEEEETIEGMMLGLGRSTNSRIAVMTTGPRRISFGSSVDSLESEGEIFERPPPSQLEQLVDRSLESKSASESFAVVKKELSLLFKGERTTNALNKKILNFLDTQLHRSEIDPRRSPEKNIQCVEIQILVELYRLRLCKDVEHTQNIDVEKRSKALSKLRFLNIITGGSRLETFMRETMDPEFAPFLPEQLKLVHEQMCIDMSSDAFSYLNVPTTILQFSSRRLSKLTVDTPYSIASTPRNRSNSTPQSSSSALSGFREDEDDEHGFPALEKMTSLGSPPSSPMIKGIEELNTKARRRKNSSSTSASQSESKISTRRTTLNTDDDPPPQLSPKAQLSEFGLDDQASRFDPPKLMAIRRSSGPVVAATMSTRRTIKEEVVEGAKSKKKRASTTPKTQKVSVRVDARGSIASRRQTNKRLCVIRQNTNGLIQPTSRRSSTASLLQKQQAQETGGVKRRSSYFERLSLEVQKQALLNVTFKASSSSQTKKQKLDTPPMKEDASITSNGRKSKNENPFITEEILERCRKRIKNLYENSKQIDEHEVFYGRCNVRVDLFEREKNEEVIAQPPPQKPKVKSNTKQTTVKSKQSKSSSTKSDAETIKQKNRSGHLITQTNLDCLYIAHTLLNVHNADPLSSQKPKAGNGSFSWGLKGKGLKHPSSGQHPFRIHRLVKHANRAKVLKLRQYMQQRMLKRIKQEKKEEEERVKASATITSNLSTK